MRPRIAALVLIAIAAQPAAAQLFVNDPAVVLGQAKSLLQEVKSYGTQIQQYGTQLEQARYELAQLQGFIHDPSLGGAAGLLNQTGLSNSLPVNPSAVAALASGYGSLTSLSGVLGRLSQLNGLVNTNFNANHVYTCTDTSASCAALNANAQSIAGMQGAAQAAHQDLRNHLPVIQALRERLLTATTPKDVMDAQAQLQTEQLWTQNLQSELAAIETNYNAQQHALVQRDNESIDKSVDDFLTMAKGL